MHAAVLGSPIAHSLSPALHLAAYAALGLDWTYTAELVESEDLGEFVDGLDSQWAGLSLTMPLKEVALSVADRLSAQVARVGVANTLIPGQGGWTAYNTDIDGIVASLSAIGCLNPTSARILGAGATARSAVAALARMGTQEVMVCARRLEQAREISELAWDFGMSASVGDLSPELAREELLISVLPGNLAAPWASLAHHAEFVLDASYHPWPSALVAGWDEQHRASGKDMLLYQAAAQVALMTGLAPPLEAMRAAIAN